MRLYTFTNMYLSPIQHGIQSAHCLAEMYVQYAVDGHDESLVNQLTDWADNHKTIVVLNGGTGIDLSELQVFLDCDNPFPWWYFHEPSLDNAKTCVGIILPERIYEPVRQLQNLTVPLSLFERTKLAIAPSGESWTYTNWEVQLIIRLTKYQLAR